MILTEEFLTADFADEVKIYKSRATPFPASCSSVPKGYRPYQIYAILHPGNPRNRRSK